MNKFFICLLGIAFSISLFTLGKASYGCLKYVLLSSKQNAYIDNWKIEEKNSSSFSIEISYHFFINDKKVLGKTELAKPFFLSRKAAEEAVETLQKKSWSVFFPPSHIEMNTLQRHFPFRDCIHALLSIGVVIYFLILKRWVHRLTV